MKRCRKCNVPLEGFLSVIPKLFFGVTRSSKDHGVCNKCVPEKGPGPAGGSSDNTSVAKPGEYRCQICGRSVTEAHALAHVKAEEYLINLIRKDHPEWKDKKTTCPECIAYYRTLIKETEI